MNEETKEQVNKIMADVNSGKIVYRADIPMVPVRYYFGKNVIASDPVLANLQKALMTARANMTAVKRSAANKYEGYMYSDLESNLEAVEKHLAEQHLVIMQFVSCDVPNKTVTVYTRLTHLESAEWCQHELTLTADDKSKGFTPKTQGACITYGRKYGVKAIIGTADASDDDVDKESERTAPAASKAREKAPQKPPATAETRETVAPATKAEIHTAGASVTYKPETGTVLAAGKDDPVITAPIRKKLFDDCYGFGANNDHIMAAIKAVTGQESSKLVRQSKVEEIKAKAYKLANPGSEA